VYLSTGTWRKYLNERGRKALEQGTSWFYTLKQLIRDKIMEAVNGMSEIKHLKR
jgi:hypothetical protein